jgi:putative MATE family efflux protein
VAHPDPSQRDDPRHDSPSRRTARALDREIWRLALPAFLALVAEPLFLLADAAIVGHLGTDSLAGLGVAAAVLQTLVGLCVFLAYGTTASVARLLGAGDRRAALAQGIDGVWLAVLIGVVATLVGVATTGPLVRMLGAEPAVAEPATTYLRIAYLGVTPLLVMMATTGVLRGLQDTRTPLVVAVGGNALNVALNLLLVYGVGSFTGLGIAGSALGSVLAQAASAAALLWVVIRGARREGASLRPDMPGIRRAAHASVALVIRTLTLRAALLLTTYAVVLGADSGDAGQSVSVATHQLAFTIWSFLAFALDAIAIAAQAITGRYLGAGDRDGTREVTRRMVGWGALGGVVGGAALAAASPFLGPLFSSDGRVHELLVPVLLVAAAGQPVAGVVFVLDGVLIGAGDGTYLAWAGLAVLVVYAPVVVLVGALGGGVVLVWLALSTVLMGARLVVLLQRARGDAWLVTGGSFGR